MKSFLPFVVSFALSLAAVPFVRHLSFRLGKIKLPRQDRWHTSPTPTLGGVGIFFSFGITVLVFLILGINTKIDQWTLLVGPVIMFLLGLLDDLRPLRPPIKLGGQLFASTLVIFFGDLTIRFFPWPIANIILTYFWLIGISNAINLLDNMDGLASGIAFIAAGMLGFFAWGAQDSFILFLLMALGGAILGFLFLNLPPARIFMGDSGSLFIGFTLALLAVARRTQASNVLAILGVPILIFLLPILDTTLVTVTRILRGQSPTQGGTDHTSHRLVSFGLSERQVLFILYGIALLGGISAAALEALDYDISLGLIPIVLVALALLTAYLGQLKVVTTIQGAPGNITRWMSDLTYRRRLFETLLDLALVGTSYYLAFWTRNGLDMNTEAMTSFMQSWPIALVWAYVVFYITGVYRGLWRYFGLVDLIRFLFASLLCGVLTWGSLQIIFPDFRYPLEILALFSVFLFLSLSGSRASFSLLDRLYNRQRSRQAQAGIFLYGAGDMGEVIARWLLRGSNLGFRPLGFIDEDERLWSRTIHGIDILGGINQIEKWIDEYHPSGVLVTTMESDKLTELIKICHRKQIWVKRVAFDLEELDDQRYSFPNLPG